MTLRLYYNVGVCSKVLLQRLAEGAAQDKKWIWTNMATGPARLNFLRGVFFDRIFQDTMVISVQG
jgi:hypothetical protein